MAAATATLYRSGVRALAAGSVRWADDPIAVVLVSPGYFPSVDGHGWREVVAVHELTGARAMRDRSVGTGRSREVALRGAGVSFEIEGELEFRYAVIVNDRGGDPAGDELVGFVDFGRRSVRDATIRVDFAENVVATYTVQGGR